MIGSSGRAIASMHYCVHSRLWMITNNGEQSVLKQPKATNFGAIGNNKV